MPWQDSTHVHIVHRTFKTILKALLYSKLQHALQQTTMPTPIHPVTHTIQYNTIQTQWTNSRCVVAFLHHCDIYWNFYCLLRIESSHEKIWPCGCVINTMTLMKRLVNRSFTAIWRRSMSAGANHRIQSASHHTFFWTNKPNRVMSLYTISLRSTENHRSNLQQSHHQTGRPIHSVPRFQLE